MAPKILHLIFHVEDDIPGPIIELAQELQFTVLPHFVHQCLNEEILDIELGPGSAIISLGGAGDPRDDQSFPWISTEKKLFHRAFEKKVPILGICLGAQILALAFDAEVTENAVPEFGWHPVKKTPFGKQDALFGGAIEEVEYLFFHHWHQYTFEIPENAQVLAFSDFCPRQAFKLNDRTYGVQFHPEVNHLVLEEWLAFEGTHSAHQARLTEFPGEDFIQTADVMRERAKRFHVHGTELIRNFLNIV